MALRIPRFEEKLRPQEYVKTSVLVERTRAAIGPVSPENALFLGRALEAAANLPNENTLHQKSLAALSTHYLNLVDSHKPKKLSRDETLSVINSLLPTIQEAIVPLLPKEIAQQVNLNLAMKEYVLVVSVTGQLTSTTAQDCGAPQCPKRHPGCGSGKRPCSGKGR